MSKKYNNEKAIIAITSWKGRINTVYKTIQNLLDVCPGFHIVMTLSEEEFPNKEKDLPSNLMDISDNFEILWVYKNWRSLKKIVFAMDKYKTLPIISADDDALYKFNYAEVLYNTWKANPIIDRVSFISPHNNIPHGFVTEGACTLYRPNLFEKFGIAELDDSFAAPHLCDDDYYAVLCEKYKLSSVVCINYDTSGAIHAGKKAVDDVVEWHDTENAIRDAHEAALTPNTKGTIYDYLLGVEVFCNKLLHLDIRNMLLRK